MLEKWGVDGLESVGNDCERRNLQRSRGRQVLRHFLGQRHSYRYPVRESRTGQYLEKMKKKDENSRKLDGNECRGDSD